MPQPIEIGQLFWVCLDPVVGHEIGMKVRPAVVVSITDLNKHTSMVAVMPGTTTPPPSGRPRHTVEVMPDPSNRLRAATFFKCQHVRGIDQCRIGYDPFGRLSPSDLIRLKDGLIFCFGLPERPTPLGRQP